MDEKTVTISARLFSVLIEARDFLLELEAGGVDNWDGYDDARERYYGEA